MTHLRILIVTGLAVMLAGCLLSPGKFAATMDIRRDGTFSYGYEGQIYLLALSKLAEMGAKAEAEGEDYVEQPCWQDGDEVEERDCTAAEKSEQKREWEAEKGRRKAEAEREAETMRAMLGGIDPADPAAAKELADRLRRQAGWEQVDYKGDGLFEVRFRISGRLDHDFLFPTMERFPMSNFFVLANRRDGGAVRIDAPGFAAQSGANPFQGIMSGMAGAIQAAARDEKAKKGESDAPLLPQIDGTFTLTTDAAILANNTDEGPIADPAGKRLSWRITPRTQTAPTALLQLDK